MDTDRSFVDGHIDYLLKMEAICEKVRNEHIAVTTVVLVLTGRYTWSRRFADWEIGLVLNQSRNNSRCEVLGPDCPNYGTGTQSSSLLRQRLAANIGGDDPHIRIYDWQGTGSLSVTGDCVYTAFLCRDCQPPYNHSKRFNGNRDVSTHDSEGMT